LVHEFRGYDYVVVNDEIVIVDPSTRRVAEVIREGGGGGDRGDGDDPRQSLWAMVADCIYCGMRKPP
jgi:hypothetical protein